MFEDLLTTAVRAHNLQPRTLNNGECQSADGRRCHLCYGEALEYPAELQIKNGALQEFWTGLQLPVPLQPLIPSPLGRGYRTVTKRKGFSQKGGVNLALIDPDESGKPEPFVVQRCAIEPDQHAEIYRKTQEALEKPYAKPLAEQLSYVVIKGNYREFTLILNVRDISGKVVKASNTLSKSLTRLFPSIVGLFLYLDETGGKYYLGVRNSRVRPIAKKLFGKSTVFQKVCGKTFFYSPLSFSQVNQSLLERLVSEAGTLLALTKESRLYDLYCGYGLFALCLGEKAGSAVGVEISPDSVESAMENGARQHADRVRFMRSDITADTVGSLLWKLRPSDRVILDPPRGGTAEGVIETIAASNPEKVLHLFCNIDLMPAEIKRWVSSGYGTRYAVPLDMFPGTAAVETMVLFERAK
jgi:tRNA/tmRNA/rRNA uracil-C5-methylase (TrmA/RlmC/RlmD family)